ncbi:MAG: hypothetical protein WD628_02565, partial [Thermomicrobiales bacterium]
AMRKLGFKGFRVRHHDNVARIELEPDDMQRALDLRDEINAGVIASGYAFVTLDLGGYTAGNLNKLLKPKVIAASRRAES